MKTKNLTAATLLTALALVFSYIEFLIPFNLGIPGVKLGLANIVILIALFCLSTKHAFAVNVTRVLISCLLFSGLYGCMYAMAGALLSLSVMALLKKTGLFSVTGISVAGAISHNFGQILMAALIVSNLNMFAYFPLLIFSGLVCGLINGFISHLILKHLPSGAFSFVSGRQTTPKKAINKTGDIYEY